MPLYETIIYLNSAAHAMETKTSLYMLSEIVWKNGGVIRRLDYQGIIPLAFPMKKHHEIHFDGKFIVLLFDGSYKCLKELNERLDKDTDVFRWVTYRQKDPFRDIYDEMYYHKGIEMGKTQEAKDALYRKTSTQIFNIYEDLSQHDFLDETRLSEYVPISVYEDLIEEDEIQKANERPDTDKEFEEQLKLMKKQNDEEDE